MSGTSAGQGRVSSAVLLGELRRLRQRNGFSPKKLRDECAHLLALPITTAELQRRGLDQSDRHLAAEMALKCAVNVLVPTTEWARVLTVTLNLKQADGILTARRARLQLEFGWTEKAYRLVEEEAYIHLAGQLVLADDSPCRGEPKEHWPERISLDLTITGDPDELVFLLTRLTLERRERVRDALADVLLSILPRALQTLDGMRLVDAKDGPWRRLQILMDALLVSGDWRSRLARQDNVRVLSNRRMANILTSDEDFDTYASDLKAEIIQLGMTRGSVDNPATYEILLQFVSLSLMIFGASLQEIEAVDGWVDVIGGLLVMA